MNNAKPKLDIYRILSWVFLISFIFLNVWKFSHDKLLNSNLEGLEKVELISSGIQRISKLELEYSSDEQLITSLDSIVNFELFYNYDLEQPIYFSENEKMTPIINGIYKEWISFKSNVMLFRENDNREDLFKISEYVYSKLSEYESSLNSYIDALYKYSDALEKSLIANMIISAMILMKILSNTVLELQKNKELSKDMFIDTSTGLYNRSKCQEVLKTPLKLSIGKERAIIICDLNGLKKTNDEFGHRTGDKLISCFATELKNATNVLSYDVFVGRYGGDEFMVSIDFTTESDVQLYIKEVEFLMKCFNETQNKPFELSCAIGYAITTKDTKSLTSRELFDLADENMYKNKLAMKEKQRKELYNNGLTEPVDDRL